MNRKSEVSFSLSLLGRALWINGDIYPDDGMSLTWMCLHGEAPLYLMAVPVGERRSDEEERQGQWTAWVTGLGRNGDN
jgi:hypothetical protein